MYLDEELTEVSGKDMTRAERRRNLRAVRRMGLRDVPRSVRRETFNGLILTRPFADGKSPDMYDHLPEISCRFTRKRAHGISRCVLRQFLAVINTESIIEEIRERGYEVKRTGSRQGEEHWLEYLAHKRVTSRRAEQLRAASTVRGYPAGDSKGTLHKYAPWFVHHRHI